MHSYLYYRNKQWYIKVNKKFCNMGIKNMCKSLKTKITFVYLGLVFIIAFMGSFAYLNLSRITNSIDGFLIDNYKSINAANNMVEKLEKQNICIVDYINLGDDASVNSFYKESNEFNKWFNIEWNNITEKDERSVVVRIKNNYAKFLASFSKMQQIRKNEGLDKSVKYYNKSVIPSYLSISRELRELSRLNEQAMFENKGNITTDARRTMNLVLILSISLVIVCFFLSTLFINKFLKPVDLLTETMKLVKEGDMNRQAPVISKDEIGNLAKEFNNMTKRLQQFEQSTLGKLMNEKNKSLSIVKSISEPLVVLDKDHKIMFINDKCEKFFNIQEEDVVGKHFLEVIRNGDIYDFINSIYKEYIEENHKIFAINRFDNEFFFNVTVTLIRDTSLKLEGVVVFFQDITQLKILEKVRADFVSSISHEFKTPLTSLTFGASLLKNNKIGQLNQKQNEIVDTIEEEAYRLSALVNDLLKLSKVECEKPIFNMEYLKVENIIKKSIEEFRNQAKDKNIQLHYLCKGIVKDVRGDEEKLNWVINNLISNALKFTPDRGEVCIEYWQEIDKVYVAVKDTGIGIPEQYVNKIFDKFMQIHQDSNEIKGTGLGLAICKQIIEVHGGDIWCESKMGGGSTFTFYIPIE